MTTTWKLDSAHTQITFSAKHMMVTNVRGTFHEVEGTIELDEADPTRSHGEFRVAAASIDTNFGARDAHLKSADFFDAERYPWITFRSTAITPPAATATPSRATSRSATSRSRSRSTSSSKGSSAA